MVSACGLCAAFSTFHLLLHVAACSRAYLADIEHTSTSAHFVHRTVLPGQAPRTVARLKNKQSSRRELKCPPPRVMPAVSSSRKARCASNGSSTEAELSAHLCTWLCSGFEISFSEFYIFTGALSRIGLTQTIRPPD